MGSRHFYKRGWSHSKTRGREGTVSCDFCGTRVPKYKTFSVQRSFGITDPQLKRELGMMGRGQSLQMIQSHACPACARHRKIVKKRR